MLKKNQLNYINISDLKCIQDKNIYGIKNLVWKLIYLKENKGKENAKEHVLL